MQEFNRYRTGQAIGLTTGNGGKIKITTSARETKWLDITEQELTAILDVLGVQK